MAVRAAGGCRAALVVHAPDTRAHEARPAYLERAFRVLEVRWPRWVAALPAYAGDSPGAYWTIQRVAILLAAR